MALEGVPITGGTGDNGAYMAVDEAVALAAGLVGTAPGVDTFLAKDSATQAAMLLGASLDIDALRYQGCKFDPPPGIANDGGQVREFPRLPDGLLGAWGRFGGMGVWPGYYWAGGLPGVFSGEMPWDWDPTANDGAGGAVVPLVVKQAVIYQCAWLCQPKYMKRLEAIKSGLAAQAIGSASETYAAKMGTFVSDGLCDRASRMLAKYLLKTGRIL